MNITLNANLDEKLTAILDEMELVYKNDNRPWIIGYSGGKDSTAVVQLVFLMLQRLPEHERTKKVYIISSDTLIENPIVLGYLKKNSAAIHEFGKAYNTEAHMIHPDYNNTFWTNIIGKGLPTPTSIRFRWCTERLKIKPSNTFIQEKISENGEVIVLLGVRKSESIARKIRIENRQIEGYLLTPHATLPNTYVYNPIVDLATDEVWSTLLSNNGVSPWNGNNNELFDLYAGSDGGECPFTMTSNNKGEIDTPSCGNSRFGCWICTVVKEDKSLTGFIKNGEDWLSPLLEFRTWLLSIRNKHEYRLQHRRDGNHYYKKVYLQTIPLEDNFNIIPRSIVTDKNNKKFINLKFKPDQLMLIDDEESLTEKDKLYIELLPLLHNTHTIDESKILEDEKGQYINVLGYGPFSFEARKEILKELLELQKHMQEEENLDFDLITLEELKAIDNIWQEEEDLSRNSLVNLYYEVMGEKLPWHDFKKPIFDEVALTKIDKICSDKGISKALFTKLIVETDKFKHFTNKSNLSKSIEKILNQKYLHKDLIEEIENDN